MEEILNVLVKSKHRGIFGGYSIKATWYEFDASRHAWHVESSQNGFVGEVNQYWVESEKFRIASIEHEIGRYSIRDRIQTSLEETKSIGEEERNAILAAINAWQMGEQNMATSE